MGPQESQLSTASATEGDGTPAVAFADQGSGEPSPHAAAARSSSSPPACPPEPAVSVGDAPGFRDGSSRAPSQAEAVTFTAAAICGPTDPVCDPVAQESPPLAGAHGIGAPVPGNHPAATGSTVDSSQVAVATGIQANGMEYFDRLRRRLLLATLAATAVAVPSSWLLFDLPTAFSLLIGALAGLLYLVLLARSVSRLGGDRRSIGKIQLLVPVVLVLASARIPQLSLLPALIGFLLYKPALLIQAYLDH